MFRSIFLSSLAIIALTALTGCGSEAPSSVVDGSDTSAIEEYEALIKAEEEAAGAAMAESE